MSSADDHDSEFAKLRAEFDRLNEHKAAPAEPPFLPPDSTGAGLQRTSVAVFGVIFALVVIAIGVTAVGHKPATLSDPSEAASGGMEALSYTPPPAEQASVDEAAAPANASGRSSPIQLPTSTPAQPPPTVEAVPDQASPLQAQTEVPEAVPVPAPNPSATVGNTGSSAGTTNCARDNAGPTSLVCESAYLRGLDAHISAIYRTLMSRANPEQRAQYAQEQREWIVNRDACDSINCLTPSYQHRLSTVTSEAWAQYNSQRATNSVP